MAREVGDLWRELSNQVRARRAEAMEGVARQLLAEQVIRNYVARAEFALGARVDVTDESVRVVSAAVLQLESIIPNLAKAEALQALTTVVTQQGGDISAQANQLATMAVEISGKATTSAVNALSATVTEQGGRITSQAEALTSLSAASGGDPATANFRMTAVGGPGGSSRIGAQTRIGGAGSWRGAAWYLDTPANPAQPTRFIVEADQFAVVGSSFGERMTWENGAIRIFDENEVIRMIMGRLS